MEILWNVLAIFFIVLPIFGLLYVFTFDDIYVKWKVRQFHKKIKNNIETERKIRRLYKRIKN